MAMRRYFHGSNPGIKQRRNTVSDGGNADRGSVRDANPESGGNARHTLRRVHTSAFADETTVDLSKIIPGIAVRVHHDPQDPSSDIDWRYVNRHDARRALAKLPDARAIREEGEEGEGKKQKKDGLSASHPDIWRTVIRQRGSRYSKEIYHHSLSKTDYESVENQDAGPAFEMRKHVLTIHPYGGASNPEVEPPRNPVLGNDIVEGVVSEEMIIRSPQLLRAIKDTVHWPSAAFYDGQKRLTLNSPFRSIGVHRSEFGQLLAQRKIDLQNSTIHSRPDDSRTSEVTDPKGRDLKLTVQHLQLFLNEIDKVQAQDLKLEKARHEKGLATFDMLWMLFKPGVKVHMTANGPNLACIIELLVWNRGTRADAADGPYEYVDVQMWYRDYDGKQVSRRMHEVTIHRFAGERPVEKLPMCPEDSINGNLKRQQELIHIIQQRNLVDRGKIYLDLLDGPFSLRQYDGALSVSDADPYDPKTHRQYSGKVIVDPKQHYHEFGTHQSMIWHDNSDSPPGAASPQPRPATSSRQPRATSNTIYESSVRVTVDRDKDLSLLHEWIRGFTIEPRAPRQWVWLRVGCIKRYIPDRSLITTVSLPGNSINILKLMTQVDDLDSMAVSQRYKVERIPHKGEGRIIILHGVPGLGKTYTVECLAEWSGRPLLRLAPTDLDLNPMDLERNLSRFFDRAERWRAIVFLDEADIYLSMRSSSSGIQREGVVAVFLRALEYYSGIIFLTTNRIESVDRAIINRALLVIDYKPLDPNGRATICGNCIRSFEKNEAALIDLGAQNFFINEIKDDKEYDWDGREIVQVLTLAAILASGCDSDGSRSSELLVTIDHVKEAMKYIKQHVVYRKEHGKQRTDKASMYNAAHLR